MEKVLFIFVAAAAAFGLCLPKFMRTKDTHDVQRLVWKGLGTTCGLALALTGAFLSGGSRWLCVAGLVLCVAADIMLELRFMVGMGLFIGGHFCYIAWFLTRVPLGESHGILFVILLAIAAYLIHRWAKLIGNRMIPFIIYAIILCAMGASGISCLSSTAAGMCTALGAMMFVTSDAMVCRGVIAPVPRSLDWSAMILYYAAQLCFGIAALVG